MYVVIFSPNGNELTWMGFDYFFQAEQFIDRIGFHFLYLVDVIHNVVIEAN